MGTCSYVLTGTDKGTHDATAMGLKPDLSKRMSWMQCSWFGKAESCDVPRRHERDLWQYLPWSWARFEHQPKSCWELFAVSQLQSVRV